MHESEARDRLLDLLEELGAVQSVRGALLATSNGAFAGGERSGLDASVAGDVAKTVRRMVVATSTVGSPLEELVVNFGPARMLVTPVRDEATLVVLLERDTAIGAVRSLIRMQVDDIRDLLRYLKEEVPVAESAPRGEAEDEIESLLAGELGPVLRDIEERFAVHVQRSGRSRDDGALLMREQIKEWLLCCNPSPYTFPLLLDGLAQVLDDAPDVRAAFITEVQEAVRKFSVWSSNKVVS